MWRHPNVPSLIAIIVLESMALTLNRVCNGLEPKRWLVMVQTRSLSPRVLRIHWSRFVNCLLILCVMSAGNMNFVLGMVAQAMDPTNNSPRICFHIDRASTAEQKVYMCVTYHLPHCRKAGFNSGSYAMIAVTRFHFNQRYDARTAGY
ncbi:hypothetical protein F5878DRAFT_607008 [Lentinula raphanica]|uniref:Uncharacterized protein n=1 Tax=Lentinula raphanica TaxID=153919 RepID=A0AA38PGU1_9AGAR|nr:hypothetical protein F5878DRAFT_607008 [Lentinula raphanica]